MVILIKMPCLKLWQIKNLSDKIEKGYKNYFRNDFFRYEKV